MSQLLDRIRLKVERTFISTDPSKFYAWATPEQIRAVQDRNREVLKNVPRWFDKEHRAQAIFDLGFPERLEPLIDLPIGREVTPADLLGGIAENLDKPLRFLEIGTSVGKTVYQTLFIPGGGRRMAMDIEIMNPILRERFGNAEMVHRWKTPEGSVLPAESTIEKFHVAEANIDFESARADFNDPTFWDKLGGSFNLIYYDALARDFAIRAAFDQMIRVGAISEGRFAVVFNNTNPAMEREQRKFAAELSQLRKERVVSKVGWISGWVGAHEPYRRVGIVANWSVR